MRIGVTGSDGLVGRALVRLLQDGAHEVRGFDIRSNAAHDVLEPSTVAAFVNGLDGVVHLAAVSRVIWGEREPLRCYRVNVQGTLNLLSAAIEASASWFLFASSREVYGEATTLPVTEDAPLRPINIYGHSKLAAEQIVLKAREAGLKTGVVRLANVYGDTRDFPDRVVPAFCRAAAEGSVLRVEGPDHIFDFTHIDDAADGIRRLVERLAYPFSAPPIHLLPGRGVSLEALAKLAVAAGDSRARITIGTPRSYDVAKFWGDPTRAQQLLGWQAKVSLEEGVMRLVNDFTRRP